MKLLLLTLLTFAFCAYEGWGQTSTVYSVSPYDSDLTIIDSSDFASAVSFTLTSNIGTVDGCNGLAIDPTDLCGTPYVVYQTNSDRRLGTLNIADGSITDIGILSENIANIAFTSAGVLYAVSGDGSNNAEVLYTVNTTTAALTQVVALGNGVDGESIEYNPVDGLMYHWSGWIGIGPFVMETIDLNTFTITNIPLSGGVLGNVGASTYIGNDTFLVSDINNGEMAYVTTTGVVTNIANSQINSKGLVLIEDLVDVTVAPNDTICAGETVTFTQNTMGTNWGWYQNGFSLSDSSSTYTAGTSGFYTLVLEIGGCAEVSPPVSLTVNPLPGVNLSPSTSAVYCPGDSVQLTVTGGTNADFQWYVYGVMIPGAISNTYFADSDGLYNCTKTNGFGCTDSSAIGVTVTMGTLPNVSISNNSSLSFCPGDSVSLSVDTVGNSGYQWYLDGVAIAGAMLDTLNVSSAGIYNCIVTNNAGCSDSASVGAVVEVFSSPTVSLTPSGSAEFCTGDSVEIVASTGSQYQWYLNGVAIAGATNASYFAGVDGLYNCLVTNANGCSDSSSLGVQVNESLTPTVTLTPSGTVNFCPADGPVTITVDAGLAVEFYQWYADGSALPMATMNAFAANMEGTYNCIITSSAGCSDSASVGVTLVDTCNTSVGNLTAAGIDIYPNPSSELIHINLNDFEATAITQIMLLSADGRLVYQSPGNELFEEVISIDVSNEVKGNYFLIIDSNTERFVEKLSIE